MSSRVRPAGGYADLPVENTKEKPMFDARQCVLPSRIPRGWGLLLSAVLVACGSESSTGPGVGGELRLSRSTVRHVGEAGDPGPGPEEITLSEVQGSVGVVDASVIYPDDAPTGWVDVFLSGTELPATLTVTVDPSGLAWGGYWAAVVVRAERAVNGDQVLLIEAELTCPGADGGTVTVCGTLLDVGTGEPAYGDPSVTPYDAVTYAGNPSTAEPLSASTVVSDVRGRFRAVDVSLPTLGPLLLVAEDEAGAEIVPSGTSIEAVGGQQLVNFSLPVVSAESEDEWTTSAGEVLSASWIETTGAVLSIFREGDARVQGVEVVVGNSSGTSFYFGDEEPSRVMSVDATRTETGANGAALTVDSDLTEHSGQGGEPVGCEWPASLAASVPGFVWILHQTAMQTGTSSPC